MLSRLLYYATLGLTSTITLVLMPEPGGLKPSHILRQFAPEPGCLNPPHILRQFASEPGALNPIHILRQFASEPDALNPSHILRQFDLKSIPYDDFSKSERVPSLEFIFQVSARIRNDSNELVDIVLFALQWFWIQCGDVSTTEWHPVAAISFPLDDTKLAFMYAVRGTCLARLSVVSVYACNYHVASKKTLYSNIFSNSLLQKYLIL